MSFLLKLQVRDAHVPKGTWRHTPVSPQANSKMTAYYTFTGNIFRSIQKKK